MRNMPRRLAQKRMTLIEWPWMAALRIARYLCGRWASCL